MWALIWRKNQDLHFVCSACHVASFRNKMCAICAAYIIYARHMRAICAAYNAMYMGTTFCMPRMSCRIIPQQNARYMRDIHNICEAYARYMHGIRCDVCVLYAECEITCGTTCGMTTCKITKFVTPCHKIDDPPAL